MPLSKKGSKILSAMKGEYGNSKGKSVFYASKNAGKISGVELMTGGRAPRPVEVERRARGGK